MSKFFDEHGYNNGKAEGGPHKLQDLTSGKFYKTWNFKNEALRMWFSGVLALRRPVPEPLNWTPEALYNLWRSVDEKELPLDDRKDHLSMTKKSKKGKQSQRSET